MLEHAAVISGFCWFLYAVTQKEMIFEWFPNWIGSQKWFPQRWRNPLFECPVCSCPWWGTAIYLILWHASIPDWIVTVFCAGGINYVVVRFLYKPR